MSENYLRLVEDARDALGSDPESARAAFREAVAMRPAYAPLWKALATACRQAGHGEEAYDALRKAAFLAPGDVGVLKSLGTQALDLGRSDEAAEWSRRAAAALRADLGRAFRGKISGLAARLGGRTEPLPPPVRKLVRQGDQAAAQRNFQEALERFTEAVEKAPDSPALLHRKARTLFEIGCGAEALEDLRRARALAPDDAEIATAQIRTLAELNNPTDAREMLDELPPEAARSPSGISAEASVLIASGRAGDAVARLTDLAAGRPDDIGVTSLLARAQAICGDFAAAERLLRKAASLPGHGGGVYSAAAQIKAMPPGSELFRNAEALTARPGASQRDRALAHFAIAKALRDAGDHAPAFRHFEQGNALTDVLYDSKALEDHVDRILASADAVDHARVADSRRGEGRVFIVGMPRSGSTLLERVVEAHPLASGVGENGGVAKLVLSMGDRYPDCLPALDDEALGRMAQEYLRLAPGGGGAAVVLDKTLSNFWHLGLIARLFPAARVLHCRRDPMAVGFSIFCQDFRSCHPYAYSQRHIGHHHRQHDRMMAHWKRTLPLAIHDVHYEELVTDPRQETQRILSAIGLSFDERCLAVQDSKGDVRTSSIFQARQKIHSGSINAWEAYADHLAPLAEALRAENAGARPTENGHEQLSRPEPPVPASIA